MAVPPAGVGNLSIEEVQRRIPTLELIDDDRTRLVTARLTSNAPNYFWEVPASVSDYHHPICRKRRELWAHTLMLSTAVQCVGLYSRFATGRGVRKRTGA